MTSVKLTVSTDAKSKIEKIAKAEKKQMKPVTENAIELMDWLYTKFGTTDIERLKREIEPKPAMESQKDFFENIIDKLLTNKEITGTDLVNPYRKNEIIVSDIDISNADFFNSEIKKFGGVYISEVLFYKSRSRKGLGFSKKKATELYEKYKTQISEHNAKRD
jgi:hypothetical protein